MNKILKEKIQEALISVFPITMIVLLLSITCAPLSLGTMIMFLTGSMLLIIGMALFSLGADVSLTPMGDGIGAELPKTRKVSFVVVFTFIIGVLITLAEPDLQVLAEQVPSIPRMTLVFVVALGVGVFFIIAMLRTLFRIGFSKLLIISYAIIFILCFFVPEEYISIAFDSGGVTTGPISVPFIMALGIGLSSIRGDKSAQDDSFGMLALCSIGPVISVLFLGMFYDSADSAYTAIMDFNVQTTKDVAHAFFNELPNYLLETIRSLLPIVVFCTIFQVYSRRFHKIQLQKIAVGFVYTLIGLTLFLAGVNVGFLPAGYYLGEALATLSYSWIMYPIGLIIGFVLVLAEPAVHVLNKQVETVTNGSISERAMMISLCIGVAVSVLLCMVRVRVGIPFSYIVVPGYAIALILTFFSPKLIAGIAFDSGGVASGPMTTSFLLPLMVGACEATGGNVLTDAFGVVALVSMTPLITIQVLGIYNRWKDKPQIEEIDVVLEDDDMIIDLKGDESDD